jgi:hypothetical protein
MIEAVSQRRVGSGRVVLIAHHDVGSFVNEFADAVWDVQGTSYPPAKDKMYDIYVLSEA